MGNKGQKVVLEKMKISDIEILDAYDDYLRNIPDEDGSISGSAIWLEAFKRGITWAQKTL